MRPNDQAGKETHGGSTRQVDVKRESFSRFSDDFGFDELRLTFEPESLVLSSGDIPQKLYLLRRGRAILIKERELRYDFVTPVEPGCIYGMVEALSGDSFEYSMKTVTQCDFGVIDKDNFLGRMSNDPVMCFRLAQTMGRLNRKILLSLTTD